jgi:hypothetical protein
MRERANWLKSQSLIEKRNLSPLKRHIIILAVSTPAATNQTAILEGSCFSDCKHLFVAANAKSEPVRKRNKTAHIAYEFLCSCGEAGVIDSIPPAQENAGFGEEHVIR